MWNIFTLSGNFSDCLETFPDCLESVQIIVKVQSLAGKFWDKVIDFQLIQKLSGLSEKFSD